MTGRRQWAIVGGVVVAVAIVLLVAMRVLGERLAPVEPGAKAPDFHAVQVTQTASGSGKVKSLADYKGQVVLLNIWATWCNPCRAEMPSLQRLQDALGPEGLKIVAVSIDNPGMEQPIREFVQELGLHFEILYDAQGDIRTDYQTAGAPETFVLGKDGVIRKRVIGATDWNAEPEKALIRQLLAEPSP
jgi:cytochrome c biogenesis protein CcmG/thiol:disulfide interchange protein DsbE